MQLLYFITMASVCSPHIFTKHSIITTNYCCPPFIFRNIFLTKPQRESASWGRIIKHDRGDKHFESGGEVAKKDKSLISINVKQLQQEYS